MPRLLLQFNTDTDGEERAKNNKEYFDELPEPLKEACQKNPHLARYFSLIPLDKTGIPEYCEKISRSDNDKPKKNLIYPVSDELFIHILSDPEGDRDFYIPIEPGMGQDLRNIIDDIEERLLNISGDLSEAETEEEKREAILKCLAKVCHVYRHGSIPGTNNGKVWVTPEQMEALKYLIIRDKLGMASWNL